MASGKTEGEDNVSRSGTAELTRDILSVLAHELGGIASALDLRTHVISTAISETDLKALRDLTEELRTTTRTIRLVRGTDGSGNLNPGRNQTVADWWKTASRFVAHTLPRGTALEAHFSEAELPAAQSSVLLWLLLAACKDIAERGLKTPCTMRVSNPSAGGSGLTLLVEVPVDCVGVVDDGDTGWHDYAAQLAVDNRIAPPAWEKGGASVRWRCTLGA